MNGTASRYLGSELQRVADMESRRRLRSASSPLTVAACSTGPSAIALSRCRGNGLECAATGDHVAAVAGDIQACAEDGTVPQIDTATQTIGHSSIDITDYT